MLTTSRTLKLAGPTRHLLVCLASPWSKCQTSLTRLLLVTERTEMSIYTDIQNDLTSFVTSTLPIKVVGENERYKPVLDTSYAQCYLLPATTVRETLGEQGLMKYAGLFQVTIRVSSQSGSQV